MRFEELMIGDFLQIKAFYRNDKNEEEECYLPVKIAQIGNSIIVEHIRPIIENEKYQVLSSFESIQPIPITPEILEKNGFEQYGKDAYCLSISIQMAGDGFERQDVTIHRMKVLELRTSAFSLLMPIKYVHQLQHALRLCGIDKTIEL